MRWSNNARRSRIFPRKKCCMTCGLWLNGSCRFISLGTIVAAETEAGFCPKSEHIIFQHWVPTFGKPILKFLGFGFAQLLLSLRLDNKCVLSILRWKTNNFRQFWLNDIIWVIFPVFPWKTHTFCTFSTLTDPKTFTMAFLCQTSAYSASGAQTCSELVRDLFGFRSGFVLFLFFGWFLQPNLVGTCSELVRVSFGSGAGSMWDCFFLIQPPNKPFLGARHNFHQFQPQKSLILPSCSFFSPFFCRF